MATTNFALLHGGGQGSWIWSDTITALKGQSDGAVNVVTLDVPGCGTKRGRDTSAIEFDDIATELIADVHAAGMADVVLVGHSQGGTLMPRMVEFAPNLFRRLIYVTCDAPPPDLTVLKLMSTCLHGEREDRIGYPIDPKTASMPELYAAMFCNDMTPSESDEFIANLDQDMWPLSSYTYRDWRYDHLGAIPAGYVFCLKDTSLPPPWQERFAERLKVQKTVSIDAGHQVMNTQPEALAKILLAQSRD
jgi:pimeloyl-ACP methyl ester carboxylesterase